jgi:hypothetical protein
MSRHGLSFTERRKASLSQKAVQPGRPVDGSNKTPADTKNPPAIGDPYSYITTLTYRLRNGRLEFVGRYPIA